VTGGKKPTSAPSPTAASSLHSTWSSALRTARPRCKAAAWAASRAISVFRTVPTVAPGSTSIVSPGPSASRTEAK
jgi:hypothetical protein